jgi:hypothetical protein
MIVAYAMVTRVSTMEVPITTPVGTRCADQRRHQQKAAADAHDGADDEEADDQIGITET